MLILPISNAIGKVQCLWPKRVNSDVMKEITQAKGETSILQTGKLCYNAINIKVFVFVPEFKSGSISRLPPHILRFLPSVYGIKKDKENTDITTQRKCEKNYHSLLLKDKIAFRK